MTPLVSIVIPLHNNLSLTQQCLASIADNTCLDICDIILADDASTDGTPDYLQALAAASQAVRVVSHETNRGFAATCNLGARAARGQYLVFLNNDTEVRAGWLAPLKRILDEHTDIGMVGPKLIHPDNTIQHCGKVWPEVDSPMCQPIHIYYRYQPDHPAVNKARDFTMLTGACIMARREEFLALGGFDEGYENGWEDDDLCYRYRAAGKRIFYCPESVVMHHESMSLGADMLPAEQSLIQLRKRKQQGQGGDDALELSLLSALEQKLLAVRDRFHRNRSRFMARWGSMLERDDLDYYREDGQSPPASGDVEEAPRMDVTSTVVSIVMLTYNQIEMTRACVESIQRNTPEPHEIIFVDNASSDGTSEWLAELAQSNPNYRLIANPENMGFSKGCNQGMAIARGEYILLLNNDVIVTRHWLQGMLECYQGRKNIGVVGPMSDNISGIQQIPGLEFGSIESLENHAATLRASRRHRRVKSRRIVGFCMLFPRELMDKIGPLDEQFGAGNFEDDDYCLRAALEGYVNLVAGDVFIHHHGSASFKANNIDYLRAMLGNRKLFQEKWSRTVSEPELVRKVTLLKTIEKAEEAAQRGNSNQAVDLLMKEGLQQFPDESAFYHALARIFMEAGMHKDALDVLHEASNDTEDLETIVLQGLCLVALGELEEAMHCAETVLCKGSEARAYCIKGQVFLNNGRQVEGEELLRAAIACDPSCLEVYLALGRFYEERKSTHARDCFKQACIVDPSSPTAARGYIEQLTSQNDLESAERIIAESLGFYPANRDIRFLYISLLLRLERHSEAMGEAERAILEYGLDDGLLEAAASIRKQVEPMAVTSERYASGCAVSLCMIVKNEEANLPRCLNSLKPLVDEIIIVDTGSTDRTREIAGIMGARVLETTWQDDYSLARNSSLEQAKGNWILVMDADEVISNLDYDAFRALIAEHVGKMMAFTIITRNYSNRLDREGWRPNDGLYSQVEVGGGWIPSDKVRLFPNDSRIRFENPIHEMVEPSLDRLKISYVDIDNVWVHHYGYLDETRQKKKLENYYLLGRKKLAESGGELKAVCELAIQAAEIERFEEAIELWHQVLAVDPDAWLAWFNLGSVCLRLGRFEEARDASQRAVGLKENFLEAVSNLAFAELCIGSYETAEELIVDCLQHNSDYPFLKLMLAIVKCCRGFEVEAREMFVGLRDKNIDFSTFLKEVASKLEMAGRSGQAGSLMRML